MKGKNIGYSQTVNTLPSFFHLRFKNNGSFPVKI